VLTWAVYDVSNDRARSRVAKRCLRAGLLRVQRSVFVGPLEPTRADELLLELEPLIDPERDAVFVFPVCKSDYAKLRILGVGFDRESAAGTRSYRIL
jgi:CRISPR-associated protein Cas2